MRSPQAEQPSIPRLDRERGELVRAVLDSDNVALAELARLRLRAANFVANHATPTDDAVAELERRELAGEPIALRLSQPLPRSDGSSLVNVAAKLPSLDGLATENASRHADEANVRREFDRAREKYGPKYVPMYSADDVAVDRREEAVRQVLASFVVLVLIPSLAFLLWRVASSF